MGIAKERAARRQLVDIGGEHLLVAIATQQWLHVVDGEKENIWLLLLVILFGRSGSNCE
jgi:hypothetical protein